MNIPKRQATKQVTRGPSMMIERTPPVQNEKKLVGERYRYLKPKSISGKKLEREQKHIQEEIQREIKYQKKMLEQRRWLEKKRHERLVKIGYTDRLNTISGIQTTQAE